MVSKVFAPAQTLLSILRYKIKYQFAHLDKRYCESFCDELVSTDPSTNPLAAAAAAAAAEWLGLLLLDAAAAAAAAAATP